MNGLGLKLLLSSAIITVLVAVLLTSPLTWSGLVPITHAFPSKLPKSLTEEPNLGLDLLYEGENPTVEYVNRIAVAREARTNVAVSFSFMA